MSAFQTFTTKVKQIASAAWAKVRNTTTRVAESKVVQTVVTKVKSQSFVTATKIAATRIGVSVAFVVVARFIKHRGRVTHLLSDWRNNHRRLVSVLWEALMVTVSYTYWLFAFTYTLPVYAVMAIVSIIVGGAVDLRFRVKHGRNYAPWHTQTAYSGLRFTGDIMRHALLEIPFQILGYEPQWLRNFVAPAYDYLATDETTAEETVEVTAETEEPTAPVDITSADINGTEVKAEEPVRINLDGNEFQDDPQRAGENLARQMTKLDKKARKAFRHGLPKKMREAGLNAREVTLGLRSFDQALATV